MLSLLIGVLGAGCAFQNGGSLGKDASKIPETSTVSGRIEALEKEVDEPMERAAGEITITFRFRPQFVLHLDDRLKVATFEPLNRDARSLKKQTKQGWKNRHYKKAVRNITEQAIIDGYISDNNPLVEVRVEREPEADTTEEDFGEPTEQAPLGEVLSVDIKEIEESVLDEVNGVIEIHGISAEVETDENKR